MGQPGQRRVHEPRPQPRACLVSGNLHSIWIYLAGPLAGGLLAVALAWALRGPPSPAANQAAQGSADGHGPDAGHEAHLGAGPDLTLWGTGREAGPPSLLGPVRFTFPG